MALNASYSPLEPAEDRMTEATFLVGQAVLGPWTFGIAFTLYVLCLDAIIPQVKKQENRRWAMFHLAYITLIFALVCIGTGCNAHLAQLNWINNRDYPGGPLKFIYAERNLPAVTVGFCVYVVASWFQDAYVIYRCSVIWQFDLWGCGLPILFFAASLAISVALLVEIQRPPQGLYGEYTYDFAICWYILSLSTNVVATFAIVGRLLWKRREITALLGKEHSKSYTGIVSMLVESAAIYSIVGVVFVGNYFKHNPLGNLVFLPSLGNLEGICPLMIIYRVATGRGWSHQTVRRIESAVLSTVPFTSSAIKSNVTGGTSILPPLNMASDISAEMQSLR